MELKTATRKKWHFCQFFRTEDKRRLSEKKWSHEKLRFFGELKMETYEKLRNARVRIGITQDYVAKQLNVPRTAIVQMENGSRKIASDELSTLCDIYGLSADYVLGRPSDNLSVSFIANSLESLSEKDQQEIASLIEYKKEIAERRIKQNN